MKQACNGRVGHQCHLLRRLQRHQAFFSRTDAPEESSVAFAPLIFHLVDVQVFAAMHFGGNVGGTDMVHDRHDHHHRDSQSGTDDIDRAVEAVLLHQVPGLFEVLFIHGAILFVLILQRQMPCHKHN